MTPTLTTSKTSLTPSRLEMSALLALCLLFCAPLIHSAPTCVGKSCSSQSQSTSTPGHWPSTYCKVKQVIFSTGDKVLRVDGDLQDLEKCGGIGDLWKLETTLDHQAVNSIVCDQVFTKGHFFTTYYTGGGASDYFRLHVDTMLPMYVALHKDAVKTSGDQKDITILPAVESQSGKKIDWNTAAFDETGTYWMQMLSMLAKPHRLLPLDRKLAGINKTICFQEAYFGTPQVNSSDSGLLHSFADYIRKTFSIRPIKNLDQAKSKVKVGLIRRSGRTKILNEEELVKSVANKVSIEIVDFDTMSVRQQIQKVQQYNVLIGMNGGGLTNALYLPKTSVAVQLVPYEAELNVEEFRNMLQARGPYMEWKNNHKEVDVKIPDHLGGNLADSFLDPASFSELVLKAAKLYKDNLQS